MVESLRRRGVVVDLLLLRRTEDEWLLAPLGAITILDNELCREFAQSERSIWQKGLAMIRTGRVLSRLGYLFLKKVRYRQREVPRSVQLKMAQFSDERRAKGLKSHLDVCAEYDCVISWEESLCNYILALRIDAQRKIGYVHPDYIEAGFDPVRDRRLLDRLDAVATVSEANRQSFCCAIPELAHKARTIPNVLSVSMVRELSFAEPDGMPIVEGEFTIITVCRLQNVSKALDRAARLCARLKQDGFCFRWVFVGSGPDEAWFEGMISDLNIRDRMILLGEKRNPYPHIKYADLFVLQSYYEGRPIVVDEAKVLGTPVLVTDYAASRLQVREGIEGFVVENEEKCILERLRKILVKPECLAGIRQQLSTRTWEELADCSPLLQACKE